MNIHDNVYEPAEDSNLLLQNVLEYLKEKSPQNICEVGVGSGFVISNVARQYPQYRYFGTDINPDAITLTKQSFLCLDTTITLKQTNLLENVKQIFDLVIFNTPYLPCEKGEQYEDLKLIDKAIYGGKKGYEVIEQFISQINDKLSDNGDVIILFSSQSDFSYITEVLENNFFKYSIMEKKDIFFETLYCLKISKSEILRELSQNGVTKLKYLTKGKHSKILSGVYRKKEVIVKIGEFKDLQIEEIFLKKLQKHDFVPKLYFSGKQYIVMQKLNGIPIGKYLKDENSKTKIIKTFENILNITFKLDELGINKFELINPRKHIYIEKDCSVKFIDFERTLYTQNPKNTTQILEYIRRLTNIFKEKKININTEKIFEISKKYKKKKFKFSFKDLMNVYR